MPWFLTGRLIAIGAVSAAVATYAIFCLGAIGLSIDANQEGVRESLSWVGGLWPYLEVIAFLTGWLSIILTVVAVVLVVRGRQQRLLVILVPALFATIAFIMLVPERVAEQYIANAEVIAERIRRGMTHPNDFSQKLASRKDEVLEATRAGCGALSRQMSSPRHSQYVFATSCARADVPLWIWVRYAKGVPKVTLSEGSEYPIM